MARAIGLDIGAAAIKVVELGGSTKSPKIQRLAIREIPPAPTGEDAEGHDQVQVVADLVKDVFQKLQLPKDDVCASFDSGVTVFREITVPFIEEDQIRKVIRFEAENHLHNHGIDEVVVNWIKTGETRDGSRVMVFASPKDVLEERLAMLRRAGVRPASVDLDTTALYSTLEAIGRFEDAPDCIVLDVGAHTTNLVMVVGGKPRVMRSFLLGAGGLESAVGGELGVGQDEGRERVLQPATTASEDLFATRADVEPPERESEKSLAHIQSDIVVERRDEFVRKLHREVVRSLLSVRADATPEKILLMGGGALIPGLDETLGERFGLPVERVNLLDRIDCKDPGAAPDYTGAAVGPAVGCGLRMMGHRGLGIELLQDEFAPKNTFDVVKTALCTLMALLFVAVLGVTYIEMKKREVARIEYQNWAWAAQQQYIRAESEYRNKVDKDALRYVDGRPRGPAYDKALAWLKSRKGKPTFVSAIHNRLRKRHGDLQGVLGLANNIPALPSALECWLEVYKALSAVERPELGEWFQVQRLEIGLRRMAIRLVMSNSTVSDRVEKLLSASEYLKGRAKQSRRFVQVGQQTRQADGRVRVEFTIEFKEE